MSNSVRHNLALYYGMAIGENVSANSFGNVNPLVYDPCSLDRHQRAFLNYFSRSTSIQIAPVALSVSVLHQTCTIGLVGRPTLFFSHVLLTLLRSHSHIRGESQNLHLFRFVLYSFNKSRWYGANHFWCDTRAPIAAVLKQLPVSRLFLPYISGTNFPFVGKTNASVLQNGLACNIVVTQVTAVIRWL